MSARKKAAKKDSTANLGFEAKLWLAADKLRNNMDAAEYKHVVLGLIFLKYISDTFEEHRAKLLAGEGDYEGADPEDPDEYKAENVFWVPADARWPHLQASAKQPTIGKTVDDAMVAIERDNPRLKGVLPKDYARPGLDKHRLGELIDLIDLIATISLTAASEGEKTHRSVDLLGRVYEYFLTRFASAEGKNGGQFYTPSCVVRCLVEMLAPYKGRIYDPACGSGGMFVQSEKFVESHGGKLGDISIYGQDQWAWGTHLRRAQRARRVRLRRKQPNQSNSTTRRLAVMNLAIRGIEADLVDCMVALPGQLFYSTQIPVCLWFISKNKKGSAGVPPASSKYSSGQDGHAPLRDRRKETLFIDARKLGTLIDRVHRELTDADLDKITSTYHAWRGDSSTKNKEPGTKNPTAAYADVAGFCKSATTAEIANHGHVLTPGRYVGAEEVEDDGEPFEEKMPRLVAELNDQFAESAKLESAIRKNLKGLGYAL